MTDRKILDALEVAISERPSDFSEDAYTLKDKKTGVQYWVANGRWNYGVYRPTDYRFGFFGRRRFAKLLRKWRIARVEREVGIEP